MKKCDLDGVPFIVQHYERYQDIIKGMPMIAVKLFNGKLVNIPEEYISMHYPFALWRNITRLELYELLERFMENNLELIK